MNRYTLFVAACCIAAAGIASSQTVVDCYPFNAPLATGSTTSAAVTHQANINAPGGPVGKEAGWAKFDLSAIPPGATVSSVVLYINVTATNWPYWSATPVTVDPMVATPATLQSDIVAEENVGYYLYQNEGSTFAPGPKQYTMGGTINADVQNGIAQGWIAVGFSDRDTTATYYVNFSGYDAGANAPYLRITYTGGGPALIGSATAGTAQTVFSGDQGPGGNGIHAGTFDIACSFGAMSMQSINLTAAGNGDDSLAYTEVTIYQDMNNNDTFEFGTDEEIVTAPSVFPGDNGTINFSVQTAYQGFLVNDTRTYFVVVKLAGTASAGQTFNYIVSGLTVGSGSAVGFPTAEMLGLIIATPAFVFTDASPALPSTVYLGSSDNVCQIFTIAYPDGPDDKPTSVTVTGLGTAHEVDDLVNTQLWLDSDTSGDLSGGDTLLDTQSFSADNGTATFDLSSMSNMQAGQTRTFFVVHNLNNNAGDGETLQCYVSAAAVGGLAPNVMGLPAPNTNGAPGLEISASVLIATLNGPGAALTIDSDSQGSTGDGELLCDVTLAAAPGGAWTVSSMTFNAAGTGDANNAFSELALWESSGGGGWAGSATASLASGTTTSFAGGAVSFNLTNSTLAAATSRRFFLTGKLNGSALAGQTFNANLESIAATPPPGGSTTGIPTADSTALIIDVAVLTVSNGPNQPTATTHRGGTAANYLVGQFRLHALNGPATVNSINLTGTGTGDWGSDIDSTSGVQLFLDDGDGVFDAGLDTPVFQGGGAALVTATLSPAVAVPGASTADIWVRIGLSSNAGMGIAATPETFVLSIAGSGDVSATSGVLLGTPAPTCVTLGAIEFNVSLFAPASDLPKGGKAINIQGSGFMQPFSVTIDGVICPGTAVISGGTQVTGLTVPPGTGSGLQIVVTSGTLPPQTLTQTFKYSTGDSSSDSNGSCSAGSGPWLPAAIALVMLGAATAWRRRRA